MNKLLKLSAIIAVCVATSCKKDLPAEQIKNSTVAIENVKLEDDYLAFKDYDAFLSTYQTIGTLQTSKRLEWENSLKFKSLNSLYASFNRELDQLEKLSKEKFDLEYIKLKEKYKSQIVFDDSTYHMNCSGINESYLANKNGIIKIGNDFLHFSDSGIETLKEKSSSLALNKIISIRNSSANGKISHVHTLNASPVNSFTVKILSPVQAQNSIGRYTARLKIYNIHTTTAGYRGFITLEAWAQHNGFPGGYRDVKSLTSAYSAPASSAVILTKTDVVGNVISTSDFPFAIGYTGPLGDVTQPIETIPNSNPSLKERYELVLMCSTYLKNNPSSLFGAQSLGVFGNITNTIDDDFLQPYGYWSSFGIPQNAFIKQFSITGMSVGTGLAPATIFYNTIHANLNDY